MTHNDASLAVSAVLQQWSFLLWTLLVRCSRVTIHSPVSHPDLLTWSCCMSVLVSGGSVCLATQTREQSHPRLFPPFQPGPVSSVSCIFPVSSPSSDNFTQAPMMSHLDDFCSLLSGLSSPSHLSPSSMDPPQS